MPTTGLSVHSSASSRGDSNGGGGAREPANADPGDLLESLPHLLHRASQGADWHIDRLLSEMNMTFRQFSVLEHVDRHPGHSQIQVGAKTGIDRSTLVNILDRLQSRELVTRNRSDNDRRAVMLELTDRGRRVLEQARPIVAEVNAKLLSELSDDHRDAVLAFLRRIGSSRG